MSSDTTDIAEKEIEVEQKFSLSSNNVNSTIEHIHKALSSLGFQPAGPEIRFSDTYMEVLIPNKSTCKSSTIASDTLTGILTAQHNYWFRYRELQTSPSDKHNPPNKGAWQLKRPPKSHQNKNEEPNTNTAMSVYEELEGQDAIRAVQNLLQKERNHWNSYLPNLVKVPSSMEFYHNSTIISKKLPKNLQSMNFIPFASFETTRSSWKYAQDPSTNTTPNESANENENKNKNKNKIDFSYQDLKIDIDGTDFGYMVGEVEIVVHQEDQIPAAQKCIQDFIHQLQIKRNEHYQHINKNELSPNTDDIPSKLESFLIIHFPQLNDACVKSGSL